MGTYYSRRRRRRKHSGQQQDAQDQNGEDDEEQEELGDDKATLKERIGVPESETINKSIIRRVKDAKVGNEIKLPTQQGRDRVLVTKKMKAHARSTWNANYAQPLEQDI